MPRANLQRFTVYDVMEARGVFRENSANADSPEYSKSSFPKMLYHPQGLERVSKPAEVVNGPYGPKEVGEQRELVTKLARSRDEELELLAEGWHPHPALAIKAAGKPMPPMSSQQRIEDLEAKAQELEAQLEEARRLLAAAGQSLPEPAARVATVDPLIA